MSNSANVTVYSTKVCPFCVQAKKLLESKNISYQEFMVDISLEKRTEMLERSNGRKTVPQIFIGNHHVGGYDDLVALEQQGQLQKLLASN